MRERFNLYSCIAVHEKKVHAVFVLYTLHGTIHYMPFVTMCRTLEHWFVIEFGIEKLMVRNQNS